MAKSVSKRRKVKPSASSGNRLHQLKLTDLWGTPNARTTTTSTMTNLPASVASQTASERAQDVLFTRQLKSAPTATFSISSPPSNWPWGEVEFITEYRNTANVEFDTIPPFQVCDCDHVCRSESCENARANIYCSRSCCKFRGKCGNGIKQKWAFRLVQQDSTFGFGVYAAQDIDAGVILGEYLGEFKLLTHEEVLQRRGYLLEMKATPRRDKTAKVYIDATRCGNMTRFLNHPCKASAKFEELCNRSRHTVVVVSVRAIKAGEPITVDYKGALWFNCKCGENNCRSKEA